MSSYVIVPQNGFYEATSNKLLLDLGHLKVIPSNSKKMLISYVYVIYFISTGWPSLSSTVQFRPMFTLGYYLVGRFGNMAIN